MANKDPPALGKIALITGSTSGIGLAIAEKLAQNGAKVVISSRTQKNVDATVKKFKQKEYDVVGIACHIGKKDQRQKLVEKVEEFGVLDIFVQCVGANSFIGPILSCPEEAWDKTFNMNLKTTFLLTKELLHLLKKSKNGRIIYNSSMSAYTPYEILGTYSVSKLALVGFTKSAALNLGRYNITVNCIVPGAIDTPFGSILSKDETIRTLIENLSALKRFGKPEEVAGIVAFLASEDSSYISGEAICVNGGLLSRL